MCPIAESPQRADVNESGYTSLVVAVGTSEVEAKVGSSRSATRQVVLLFNDGTIPVYYGPTGVTISGSTKGIPLQPQQEAAIPIGDVGVFLIAGASGGSVIVQEVG